MLIRAPRRQAGVSLIELMIGIVVGLIVLWGMSTVYLNAARGGRTTNAANALNQDMRAVMDIMVNDIRRAGYWNTAAGGVNPFTAIGTTDMNVASDCILYSYDAAHAGSPVGVTPGTDFFGFRFSGTAVQALRTNTLLASTATCTGLAWENLTEDKVIKVTDLTFDTIGSQCLAYTKTNYTPTLPGTFTTWKTTAGAGNACNPLAPGAPASYPGSTNNFVEARVVNIRLKAKSLVDTTLPERVLTETVLVRNNRVTAP